jgi:hypothetical protein
MVRFPLEPTFSFDVTAETFLSVRFTSHRRTSFELL